jgi:hypothetical protein
MNLYGFAEKYLKSENLLDKYTADLLFRYLQLQVNEMGDKYSKQDTFVAESRTFLAATLNR